MEIHLPPKLLGLSIILTVALYFIYPITIITSPPYNLFGLLMILLGVALGLWTKRTMKLQNTTLHPQKISTYLVTTGPFKLSRNPYYVGYVLGSLGLAVALGGLPSFISPLLFMFILDKKIIPIEERNLQNTFGLRYTDYAKRVRRWI